MNRYPAPFPGGSPRRGQMAIAMVISILLFLMMMFPIMNLFVQNEGKWSVKEKKATAAFHLAEAGVDRARWKLMENTDMWTIASTGTIAGYHFDIVYKAEDGGTYAINISSDPSDADKRIVESVGRDKTGTQTRRIRAVLINDNAADFATRAVGLVTNTGNEHVEWGPVYSGTSIKTGPNINNANTFPRMFSAGHVDPQDGGSTVASTDDRSWWSYYALPPEPKIKFAYYISSAQNSGNSPCDGKPYYDTTTPVGTARTFAGCTDTSGKPYYIVNGDIEFASQGGGNYIVGTVIAASGRIYVSGNGGGSHSGDYRLPPEAWKEYGYKKDAADTSAWDHYKTFDTDAPATWDAAVASNYVATNHTYHLTNVLVHGFLYAGGGQGLSGGGNGNIVGALFSKQAAAMGTSTMCLYYDDQVTAGIVVEGVNIRLFSWYEVRPEWPSGL